MYYSNLKHIMVISIGVPGAGKGTFSNIFVKNLGWKTLSLGDLLRAGKLIYFFNS